MSQKTQILEHLKEHGSITPLEALRLFGCFRLAARIHELRRKEGWPIQERDERNATSTYARYILIQGELPF